MSNEGEGIHGTRVRRGKGHESIRREALQDVRLSFKALGILTYLLSLPDTWKTNSERLGMSRAGKEGQHAVRSGLKELEEAGYLLRKRIHLGAGKWRWIWAYTDSPGTLADHEAGTEGEFPSHSFPPDGPPPDGPPSRGKPSDIRDSGSRGSRGRGSGVDTSKPSAACASAASADTADDLFTSWPGSQGLDGKDQNQTPEDQNQTTTGSESLNGHARDERADARATNAGHVTAAWVDAYTAVRGDDVAPTRRQIGQASRCAKELLDAGNDAGRVMKAARLAGAAGYPTIDRQLAMMTAPRTYGRNGHVPYENPTDASVYLEPIQ